MCNMKHLRSRRLWGRGMRIFIQVRGNLRGTEHQSEIQIAMPSKQKGRTSKVSVWWSALVHPLRYKCPLVKEMCTKGRRDIRNRSFLRLRRSRLAPLRLGFSWSSLNSCLRRCLGGRDAVTSRSTSRHGDKNLRDREGRRESGK